MPGGCSLVACFLRCGHVTVDLPLDAGYDRVTDVVRRVPKQRAVVVEEITCEVRAGHGYHGFTPSGNPVGGGVQHQQRSVHRRRRAVSPSQHACVLRRDYRAGIGHDTEHGQAAGKRLDLRE
jgi:hypothetical protein